MNKSIFITRKIPDIARKMLEDKGYTVDINNEEKILTKEDLGVFLSKKPYDAVITLLTDNIDKSVFDIAPTVKIFSNYAIGFDNLDITEAKNRGVVVANSPGDLSTLAVAQHTMAFILALSNRLLEADNFVRNGKYVGWEPMNFIGNSLFGKKIGIVGAGRIGDMVASFAKGLGLEILYTNHNRNEEFETKYGAIFFTSIEEMLPQIDFLTLHVPLLPSTQHLINKERLSLMKKTAFLINTSRGAVVDEVALVKALDDKIIAGAGLDVFEFEPKITPSLFSMPNVILTPHIASASMEARNQMAEIAAQNIIDFFEGKEVKNIINK